MAISAFGAGLIPASPAVAKPAPGDPDSKAGNALVNLAEYPKLTSDQLTAKVAKERKSRPAAPQETEPSAELISEEILPDGRLQRSIYTLVPEANPDEVAESLRKQGEKNVRVVRHAPTSSAESDVRPMGPGDCAYGSARTLTCPNSWWPNLGRHNPVVLFNDHSSAAWPTTNAVYKWNQTPNIDSWYTWNNCNQINVSCVNVWSGNYGNSGWAGKTYFTYVWGGTGEMLASDVHLNEYYTPTTWTRNHVVTHELGHVLGLEHNVWSGDVMHAQQNLREDIGGENPALLAQVYSIDR
nr:M43 family zinc metalloprotease [Nonomuraea zeae]